MQRKTIFRSLILPILILAVPTFVGAQKRTNLSPGYLRLRPTVSSFRDPDTDFSKYRTFSVFPFSLTSEDAKMNEIMERQILFALRNSLESRGYKFVQISDSPDFIATINVSSQYMESYVPPQTAVIPQFVPGQTVTISSSILGTFNFNNFGNYASYGWGNYSGQTTATTYIPGYTRLQTYTRPGYTTGAYYPVLSISAYDGKTFKNVWLGSGAGTSDNQDLRISSQFVLFPVMDQFPSLPEYVDPYGSGLIGIRFGIFTNDGNGYFPTILSVADGGPAKKAGAKPYDMILAIDGVPLINKPFSEALKLYFGEPGTRITLDIWRMGRRLSLKVKRVPSGTKVKSNY